MSKVLLITLSYNAPHLLAQLHKSLTEKLTEGTWHWLIRENSSDDAKVYNTDDKNVTVVRRPNTGNFASQHNELMKEGLFDGYDYICLLNNDTIAISNFLDPMKRILSSDKEVGAVGALLFFPDGKIQHAGVAFTNQNMAFNVNTYAMQKMNLWPGLPQKSREYQAVTGACLMMRLEDYKKLGGMDEKFQWAFDDVDLCLRIGQELKKKCIYCHEARLIHLENYTTLKNPSELKPNLRDAYKYINEKFAGQMKDDVWLYQADYGTYKP